MYHRRLNRRRFNTSGVDVFAEDWDNLLILDACRYDLLEGVDLPGRLESRRSRGSNTVEFLLGNVDGRDLLDTVYVTANPQLHRNRDRIHARFYDVIDVWLEDGWDDRNHTVLPETTTEYAKRAAATYQDKRLVVHYIQPHYPFLGSDDGIVDRHLFGDGEDAVNVWEQLMTGRSTIEAAEVKRLYTDNLDRTLPHVVELLDTLKGRTIVTADHGNMLGERARPIPIIEWGHPRGIYTDELVEVPWLVIDGARRKITEGSPIATREREFDDVVKRRLQDLGYRG